MVPNQIAINKMFAMVMYHLMLTAFPTAVYNAERISSWNNEIGAQIPLYDMKDGESIRNLAGYLEPASMSNQITYVIEMAIKYTKECMGITDASLGAVDPKNTSAIIAVQKSAVVPLENVKANLYEVIENLGRIILDMIATKYGTRTTIIEDEQGNLIETDYDFSQFKGKWLNIKADVGASAYYSEIANLQTLDNLLVSEKISFLQYLERLPENIINDKRGLIAELKQQMGLNEQQNEAQKQATYEQMAQYVETLPPEVQEQLKRLNDTEFEATVQQMMAQDPDLQVGGQENRNLNNAISKIVK